VTLIRIEAETYERTYELFSNECLSAEFDKLAIRETAAVINSARLIAAAATVTESGLLAVVNAQFKGDLKVALGGTLLVPEAQYSLTYALTFQFFTDGAHVDVAGKKAIIFGGTSGIGLAAAKQLAALGAEVVAISRNPDRAGALPDGITTEACDALDEEALQTLFARLAPYDVLISAATGGSRAIGPFMEMDMEGFRASFAKMWGYANVVRYGVPGLSERGSVVLVSGAPARKPRPGQVAIGAVGGAVENFARTISREIAPKRVNVVAPGQIDTPMVPLEGDERKAFYAKTTSDFLIPRPGTADEVAQGIVFAVQNDFVTGTTIDVDGGWLNA
jgi:NAD(P)-dependent dehydrogenase (short-subunit alcohol dehydrogenase family)